MPVKPRWVLADPPDPALVREYAAEFGLAPADVALALQRGHVSRDSIEQFLHPRLKDLSDPHRLPGIRESCRVDVAEAMLIAGAATVQGVGGGS